MKNKFSKKYKNVLIIKGTQGMAKLSLAVVLGSRAVRRSAQELFVCASETTTPDSVPHHTQPFGSDARTAVSDSISTSSFVATATSTKVSKLPSTPVSTSSGQMSGCAEVLVVGGRLGSTPRARMLNRAGRQLNSEAIASLNPRARRSGLLWSQLTVLALAVMIPVVTALIPSDIANRVPLAPETASAATSNQLNFQGRLLTASGALVPDGIYNMEFNLYNVSSGGSSIWTEDRLVANTQGVSVQNGYYSVYLGQYDAFPVIDWSEDLYLGMTVRGTTSCVWGSCSPADAEMTPRFKLTAVPYAFRASNVASSSTNAASTNSDGVSITTGNALGTTSNSGNISIDAGTATGTTGTISLGAANASALTLGRSGLTTTNAGALTVSQLLTANAGLTVTGTLTANDNVILGSSTADTLTVEASATFNGSLVVSAGDQFTNAGSSLFTALTISDVAGGGNIGSAATTVDVATTFNVNQTTASQTLTLPTPTGTTSGRIVYVNNVGSTSFTMYGSVIGTAKSNAFIWNGTAWVTTVSLSGSVVNTIGTIDSQTKSADGAVISSNALYLQTADTSFAGLVSTGVQTFAGAKTFNGLITAAAGLTVSSGQNLTLSGVTSCVGLKTNGSGVVACGANENTYVVAASDSVNTATANYVADGTNDEAEIESAINAANAAGGGTVLLLEGTYNISTTIDLNDDVVLIGAGQEATTLFVPSSTNSAFAVITVSGDDNVRLSGFTVDGNNAGNTTDNTDGIQIAASSISTTIDHVTSKNNGEDGFDFGGSVRGVVTDSIARDNLSRGVYVASADILVQNNYIAVNGNGSGTDGGVYSLSTKTRVIGNHFNTNNPGTSSATVLLGGRSSIIENNVFENTVSGPDINILSDDISITGNTFNNSPAVTIQVTAGVNGTAISGNAIYDAGTTAIAVSGSVTSITGNTIEVAGDDGISVSSANQTTITGNIINGVTDMGILLSSGDYHTVSNNAIFSPNDDGISLVSSQHNVISANTVRSGEDIGILADASSHYNIISNNQLYDNGLSTAADAIAILGDNNQIMGNLLYDNAGTSDLIGIASGADNNYLSDNTFKTGTYANTINNGGANTVFAGQADSSNNLVLQASGTADLLVNSDTAITGTLSVSGIITATTLGTANTNTYVCRNSSNQLATCTSAPLSSSLTDNVTDAFDLQEGTNNYININTTNSSENISFGNATTNPSFNFLGSGTLGVAGNATFGGTLAVTNGATTLTGPSGGSGTALTVNTGATSNQGLVINGASGQSANFLSVNGFGEAYSSFEVRSDGETVVRPVTGGDGDAFRVTSADGTTTPFLVNTSTGLTSTFGQSVSGSIALTGSINFSGSSSTNFTTPQGATVTTRINIPLYNPGSANQLVAMGLPSGAATNSRGISLFDNRAAGDNQPVLSVFSPDETDAFGLSSDGSNAYGYLKATSGLGLGVKSGTTVAALFETSGNTTLGYDLAVNGGDITTASGDLTIAPAGGDTLITGTLAVSTLGTSDTATYLCRNSSNILAGCTVAPLSSSLTDNITDAFDLQEGTNNYININTTNSSENISFGNTTTNPSFNFLGSGGLSVTGITTLNNTASVNNSDVNGINLNTTVSGTNSINALQGAITNSSTSGTQTFIYLQNNAGTGVTDNFIQLYNADTDTAVTTGISISSDTGGVTTALDVSDSDIVTALSVGDNTIAGGLAVIDFTNFDVAGNGNVTTAGDLVVSGGDIDATGVALNIGTTSATGVTIGRAGQVTTLQGSSVALNTDTVTTNQTSVAFLNTTATTVNAFGAATTLNLGADTGTTTVNNSVVLGSATSDLITVNGILQGGNPFVFEGSSADANETTFSISNPSADQTITFPDATGTVVLATSGSATTGVSGFVQGGNTWATSAILGTNDNNSLSLETNGTTQATLAVDGAFTLQNSVDSTSGLRVMDADGGTPVLNVDTTNERVGIGTASPSNLLHLVGTVPDIGSASGLGVSATLGSVSNAQQAGRFNADVAPTSAVTGAVTYTGFDTTIYSSSTNVDATTKIYGYSSDASFSGAGTTINQLTGGAIATHVAGSGNASMLRGLYLDTGNWSSATLPEAYGIDLSSISNTGGGAITNAAGIRVGAVTTAVNSAGIIIDETSGSSKATNLLIGTTSLPAGSYSIYNSSADANYFNGRLGIGNIPSADYKLFVNDSPNSATASAASAYIQSTQSNTANSQYGLKTQVYGSPSSAAGSGTQYVGIEANAYSNSSNVANASIYGLNGIAGYAGSATANAVVGGFYQASVSGSGGTPSLQGLNVITRNYGTGSATDAIGIKLDATENTGGGTVTSAIAILVGAQTVGTHNAGMIIGEATGVSGNSANLVLGQTSIPAGDFSIYNASTDDNIFAGKLRVGGTSAPAVELDVTGSGAFSGDLAVNGGDITTTAGDLTIAPAGGDTTVTGTLAVTTLGAADTSTYLCRNSANQVATCTGTVLSNALTDNVTDAFDLQEGTNNYININTTNSSENISFGNTTTNPSYTFLGSGTTITSGALTVGGVLTVTNGAASSIAGPTTFGSSGNYGIVTLQMQSADNFASGLRVQKRGAAGDVNGAVASGAELGYHEFYGWNGSAYVRGAYAIARSTEAFTGSANGTAYAIATTPNGGTSAVERLTVGQDGNVTLANDLAVNGGDITSAAATNLSVTSGTTGILTLDSGTTGAINLGTNANAKTLTIGNSTGTTGVNINTGSNGYDLASTGSSTLTSNGSITITAGGGSTWSTSSGNLTVGATAASATLGLTTGSGGTIELGINNTSTINIGSNSNIARTINIGSSNGSQAQAITIGSTSTSASSLALRVGTGNFTLDGAGASTYTIGASTTTGTITLGGTAQTGTIDLGVGTGAQAINLGTGAAAKAVTLGSGNTTSTTTIQGGTGAAAISLQAAATGTIVVNDAGSDTDFRIEGDTDANLFFVDAGADSIGIGTATPDARLEIAGNKSQAAWGLNGIQLQAAAATYTNTTSSGTVTNVVASSFGQPTFAASSAVTYSNAATLYIQNSPTAGSNVTLDSNNVYAFWVDAGRARFDSSVIIGTDSNGGGTGSDNALTFIEQAATTQSALTVRGNGSGATERYGSVPLIQGRASNNEVYFAVGDSDLATLSLKATNTQTTIDLLNISTNAGSSGDILTVTAAGLMGLGTTGPDRTLEINSATGGNLRLTYNDNNGSATNYADLLVSSGGALTVDAVSYTRIGDSGTPGVANGDDDLYVEGDLEVDGGITLGADTVTDITGTGLTISSGALGIDTTSASGFFQNGGNGFTAASTLGNNGNFDLNVETNNLTRLTVEADGDFAVDTDTLFVDESTNSVGIGSNAPDAKLYVLGNTASQSALHVVTEQTHDTGDVFGIITDLTVNPGVDTGGGNFIGNAVNSNIYSTSTIANDSVINFSSNGTFQSTGDLGLIIGYASNFGYYCDPLACGNVDNIFGFVSEDPLSGGGVMPSITNNVGVAIEDRTRGSNQTNLLINASGTNYGDVPSGNYSIYNGSTKDNLFAGDLFFGNGDATAMTVGTTNRSTNAAGANLTVQAGAAGSGASAFAGGVLTLQGGSAGGTGNANGGNVALVGGVGTGTGVKGLVVADTFALSTAAAQNCTGSPCAITQANVDSYGAVLITTNASGYDVTLGDPTLGAGATGRLIYITNADATDDFVLSANGGSEEINLKPNTTATMIWNGSDWTAAGASSSTDLQAAYDNTAASAGGAEIVLSSAGTGGLTIRNDATTAITGGLLEVQNSIGSNLFTVNNNATEYANNGGAESSTFTMWTAAPTAGGTITRYATVGDNIATGSGSVLVDSTSTANTGVRNTLTSTLTRNLKYRVSFAIRHTSPTTAFSTLDVRYSPTGLVTDQEDCSTANTVNYAQWTRVTCTFVYDNVTTPNSSNAILITHSDATDRDYYIDNMSVTVSADVNHAVDGSVDAALGTNWQAIGGSVARSTSVLYDTSGSVQATTSATAGRGVYNNLTSGIVPQVSTQYRVAFYARGDGTNTATLAVAYTPDNNSTSVSCSDYSTQVVSATAYTLVTCLLTTSGTTPVTSQQLRITQTAGSATSFYVDALTMTLNANNSNNVQIGGANKGGPVTLFTLDRSAGAPIAANNDAYLGSMYYDTSSGRIQCYEADGWGACGAAPDNIVNLNPEYAGAVLNGTGVGTMTADFCGNGGGLSTNTALCGSGESRNFYRWTSPQATQQTYSIYVTYQLPATFNGFSNDDTIQLTGRVDNITNAAVTYQVYRSTGSAITQCWDGVTDETRVAGGGSGLTTQWYNVGINGNEATGCGFNSSAASNFVIFKINMKANTNANAYVSTLSFTTTGR